MLRSVSSQKIWVAFFALLLGYLIGVYAETGKTGTMVLAGIVLLNGAVMVLGQRSLISNFLLVICVCVALFVLWQGKQVLPEIYRFEGLRTSTNAVPFSIVSNMDEAFIALAFLPIFFQLKKKSAQSLPMSGLLFITGMYLMVSSGLLITTALLLKKVQFEFTYPGFMSIWIINTVWVSFSEELFYRGVVQNYLIKTIPSMPNVAVLFTAVIYGLMYSRLGWDIVGLCVMAGLFYGFLYKGTKRIWCPILLHVCLNSIHFIFFSYPFLA